MRCRCGRHTCDFSGQVDFYSEKIPLQTPDIVVTYKCTRHSNRKESRALCGRDGFMKCPSCGYADSRVIDSRPVSDGTSIRRRRECLSCQKRFNTFEVVEALQIVVVKKDGSKELFDRNKLLTGLLKACQKRPVNAEEIVSEVEAELQNSLKLEVTSREISGLVVSKLKARDEVAYVRFASVYREFRDLDTFLRELNELKKKAEVTAGPAARKQKK